MEWASQPLSYVGRRQAGYLPDGRSTSVTGCKSGTAQCQSNTVSQCNVDGTAWETVEEWVLHIVVLIATCFRQVIKSCFPREARSGTSLLLFSLRTCSVLADFLVLTLGSECGGSPHLRLVGRRLELALARRAVRPDPPMWRLTHPQPWVPLAETGGGA